jgi:hypothetical protein
MKNYSNEIAELELLLEGVRKESAELSKSNNLKIKGVLDSYFNPFSELDIQVSGTSASFYMKDNLQVRREVFSLYFYERFRGETLLDLSYYTTSDCSEFELERLMNLGKVAKVVLEKSEQILKDIAETRKSDLERSNELYSIETSYQRKLQEYRSAIFDSKKVEVELLLKGDGVFFVEDKYIELKRNYTVRVVSMKIITVSKSNKTCVVQFGTLNRHDGTVRKFVEERVDVQSLVHQIASKYEGIVQEVELA